jgi:hypothetical protein
VEKPNDGQCPLLRACHGRADSYRAAKPRDEIAPSDHLQISVALTRESHRTVLVRVRIMLA